MRRSEYIQQLDVGIEMMFDAVDDNTPIGQIFSHPDNHSLTEFQKKDFIHFLKKSYLNSHLQIFDGFYDSNGIKINLDLFREECATSLLNYFKENSFKKGNSFSDVFSYKSLTNPQYFIELSEVIVSVLEKYGKPPLFHKRADKILRYDWDKE